ncbi:MAG TPA: LamG-like jellyroll fold domain-containing protein [Planctomycetota bacterium]|nr:LamG-like jellyroll fold domain-containing protein [Planctomycetota bacterium]
MGRAITYCVQCSKRVTDADLDSGKAFRVGDRILCKTCAPDSVKVSTTKKVQRPKDFGTSVTLKTQPRPPAAPPPAAASPARSRKKLLLLAGGGAGVLVLLAVVLLLLARRAPPPPNALPPENTTAVPTAPVHETDSRAESAKADLEKARAFAKAHPDDPVASQKEFDDLVWKWEGTDAAADAAKEVAAIKAANFDRVKTWMAEANAQIKDLLDKGDLRGAARKIEDVKPAHPLVQWRLAVEARVSELLVEARKADDKKKQADEEKAAAGTPAKPAEDKPLSEEAKGYPAKWGAALRRATARDFNGAISDLERLSATLKDEDLRAEAASDVKDLRTLAGLFTTSLDALKKRPRGMALTLDVRQPGGDTKKVGGLILQNDAERVEIQLTKGTAFVEWAEVASSTMAEAARDSKPGSRILGELCLLDGEVEAARLYEPELNPKWWDYGARARGLAPRADPSEKEAREAFYAAEQGYRSMETRVSAVDGYKSLRTDYGSTSIAKAYAERIARRSEACKEYYFTPADFHIEGTFRLVPSGKLVSLKDSDDPDTLRNQADLEFAVLPNVSYRCWVWAGACCEETFLFYLQGTEVTDTDPKTRKKIPCDPGSTLASPVRVSIRGLKKTHAEHKPKGASTHPKTAARWEWIEIPLPKYATPGAKRLRFMTNQAGFSIGGAVVSSTRKAAPTDAEQKDLEKDREVPEAPLLDPDLLAWWTFDEGAGTVVFDRTGKNHDAKVVGPVQWTDGKIGGAVRFTTAGPTLRVEDAEDLRLSGDLTLALWMKKEGEAGEWSCFLGKGEKQERNYCLWLEGNTRNVMFQEYGAAAVNLKATKAVSDGVWTHLAATVLGSKATIYVNGVKEGEVDRKGAASTPRLPIGMGWACEHGTFRGLLDDVRIYRRALSADEIRALVEQAR